MADRAHGGGIAVDARAAHLRPRHLRRRRRRRPSTTASSTPGCASSTGPTPSTAARPPPARCSAGGRRTTACPTSSPTSTTWAWSTRAGRRPGTYDQVVIRGDAAKREFIAFWVKDGRVLAGMNVNVWDVTDPIQQLIRSRSQVDTEALADPHVPLESRLTPPDGSARAAPPLATAVPGFPCRTPDVAVHLPRECRRGPVESPRGRQDQRRGREGGSGRGPDRRRGVRVPPAAQRGRRQPQGPVPLPRREVTVVPGQPQQGPLPLLRLPGGRRHHHVRDEGRPPHLLRGGRAPRRARPASPCATRRAAYNPAHQRGERIRLVEAHKAAAEFYAEQLDTSPEADDRPRVPRRARLRPGRRRPLRRRLQPPGLGPPHPPPARQGLHRQGTGPLRASPRRAAAAPSTASAAG